MPLTVSLAKPADWMTTDSPPRRRLSPRLRRAVVINGLASLALWLILLSYLSLSPGTPVDSAQSDALELSVRLLLGAQLLLAPAGLLLLMVLAVASVRARDDALDPIADPESRLYRILQRVLSNSVEQTVILGPAFFLFVLTLPAAWIDLAPLVMVLFVLSRLGFWAGYLLTPFWRAPGMAWTLNINGGLILYGVIMTLG